MRTTHGGKAWSKKAWLRPLCPQGSVVQRLGRGTSKVQTFRKYQRPYYLETAMHLKNSNQWGQGENGNICVLFVWCVYVFLWVSARVCWGQCQPGELLRLPPFYLLIKVSVLVSFVSLAQPRATWEGNLNWRTASMRLICGTPVSDCLDN